MDGCALENAFRRTYNTGQRTLSKTWRLYEGQKKINTSIVQIGAILYDIKNKKVVDMLNINVKHDSKTTKFIPTENTYKCAHSLTGIRFDQCADQISFNEAIQLFRKFIGNHKWILMDNDLNVIKKQDPMFALDRKEPIRLKPLLANTKASGLNSGKLFTLLTEKEKELTGWNKCFELCKTNEHTGCFDALSMAVFCASNPDILEK